MMQRSHYKWQMRFDSIAIEGREWLDHTMFGEKEVMLNLEDHIVRLPVIFKPPAICNFIEAGVHNG